MREKISANPAFYLYLITILLLTSSCATLLSGASDTQIAITSNVPEAQVFNSNKKLLGKTPLKIDGTRKENKTIYIEKDGYIGASKSIEVTEMAGFVFLDALAFGIPYFIDVNTHAIYKSNINKIDFVLRKKWDPKGEKIHSIIQEVSWKISDGTVIGRDGKESLSFRKSFFDSYIYQTTLCREMQETRYQTTSCDNISDANYQPVVKPGTIFITPEVKSLKINTYVKKGNENKTCDLEVNWKFSLSKDEFIVHEVTSKVSVTKELIDNKKIITACLVKSFYEILDDDLLFDTIRNKRKQNDFTSFNQPITIPKATIPKYTKNKELIRYMMNGVVTIELEDGGHGSGFFISEDGYILTNYHVVKKQKQVNVRLGETLTLSGEVIRVSEGYDMALIKIAGKGFNALPIGNSDQLEAGEDVLAIGTPEDLSLGQSVSKGIVSGKRKFEERVFIQTDVSVNRGNSGGPLLIESGEVMGMVTSKLIGEGTEGIGFCIPSNSIMEILNITYK